MEQLQADTGTPRAPDTAALRRRIVVGIIAASVLLLGIVGSFSLMKIGRHEPVAPVDPLAAPLLGAWHRDESREDMSNYLPLYAGFIVGSDANVLRTYQDDSGTTTLSRLNTWTVEKVGKDVILTIYQSGIAEEMYRVLTETADTVRLQPLDSDGKNNGGVVTYTRFRSAAAEAQLRFVRTPAETRMLCDSEILHGDTSQGDSYRYVLLPISCMFDIGKGVSADFSFDTAGTLTVTKDGVAIFQLRNMADEGPSIQSTSYNPGFLDMSVMDLQDLTGDGYADLRVLTSAGAYNFFYDIYPYNPQTHRFNEEPILSDIVNPSIDTAAHTISSTMKGRGLGDIYSSETYTYRDGAFVKTESEWQDWMSEDVDPLSDPRGRYVHVIQQLVNGKMSTTTYEKLTAKQIGFDTGQ